MACLALNILHMRCFFYTDKATRFPVTSGVTGQTSRVVCHFPQLQDAEVPGVFPLRICLYMLLVTFLTLLHPHIVRLFHHFFRGQGAGNLGLCHYAKAWDSNKTNSFFDRPSHGFSPYTLFSRILRLCTLGFPFSWWLTLFPAFASHGQHHAFLHISIISISQIYYDGK